MVHSRNRRARALRFEPLESRRVLATGIVATLTPAGVLNIVGTDANEQCLFRETSGSISIDGVAGAWSSTRVKAISIDLKGGNDFISLASKSNGGKQTISENLTVVSGIGNEHVRLANNHDVYFGGLGTMLSVASSGKAQLAGVALNFGSRATTSLSSTGVLTITGTDAANNFVFRQVNGIISLVGVRGSWTTAKVKSIVVNLQAGIDTVSLNSLANGGTQVLQTSVTIHSGFDHKLVRVAAGHNVVLNGFGDDLSVSAAGVAAQAGQVVDWANVVSTPVLATASDTGASTADNLTCVAAPVFTGTSAAGASVTLFADTTVLSATTADGSGQWSITSIPLSNGVHNISAQAVSLAGEKTLSWFAAITVDTGSPAISSPDLSSSSDTGSSNSDNITKLSTLTLSGTAETGATIELMDGSTVLGTTTATKGAWSLTVSALAGGVHGISARATDLAGNHSTSAVVAVTIDTSLPTISTPDLSAASDSGNSNSDNLSRITTPLFTGATKPGANVTLLEGSKILGTSTANGSGNWSIVASALANGMHTVTARATDKAGNVSATSGSVVITIDMAAPSVSKPDLTASSDSGSSNIDNRTSVLMPTFTGTSESGATITLLEGTTVLGTTTATGGIWTITSSLLAGGVHNITARATDRAGNSTTSSALAVTIDAPALNISTPDLSSNSDTGQSSTDNFTSLTSLTFSGTAAIGATIELMEGSTTLGSAIATSGVWSITASGMTAGTHNISARATDTAGNHVTSAALALTIDTTNPALSLPDLMAISDTGASNADNVTNLVAPIFVGTAEAGTIVQLFDGGILLGSTTASGSGNWSITSSALTSGAHSISARATDLAGNVTASTALDITIDTTPPSVAKPDLVAANDTGSSNVDNVTNITTPLINGTAEGGTVVQLLDGSTLLGITTADGAGNWSITAGLLSGGVHNITARATDLAGNQTTSTALTVTIDTTAPTVSAPDLTAATDTGSSNTDNITGISTPVFSGTAEAGATVQLLEGSTVLGAATANGSGAWSITSSVLADGVHNIAARATDAAGNTSVASNTLLLTIDATTLFVSAPDLAAASDSGSSSSDNVTNNSTPTFNGTATAGATVQLLDGSTLLGTATADSAGNWSITAGSLSGGVHNITARATDLAGNQANSTALIVTIDTTAPTVSAPDLTTASDTGNSNSDNVTSIATPVFTGTAEAGATVQLLEGSTVLGTATANGSGTWSITSSVLADGVHNLAARATDAAGNTSAASSTLSVTIDTTGLLISAPDLSAASDSGSSNSDNLTNISTPVFTGTATAGMLVQLLDGAGVLGSATADSLGNWSITASSLANGVHNITARATDLAGNPSTSTALTVTIDTTPPSVAKPDLAAASDSGSSNSDNVTSINTPVFTGTAEAGATVQLLEGSTLLGSATADSAGNWSITAGSLSGGVHNITARATDLAGNQANSTALIVTIDTTAPTVSAPDLTTASDTGNSNSDNVTSIATPVFTGTAEAGATVQLLEGSTVLGTATANGSGAWSITSSVLADGVHNLAARATDAAGNTSAASSTLSVTIDTTGLLISAPDLSAASDSGSSNSDNLTNISTPVFTGTATAGMLVQLLDGAGVLGSATADSLGNWSITASSLANGVHNITARATDLAGNPSTSTALTVTIDTTPPSVAKPDLAAASDSGSSNSDNVTSINTPVFTGTAEAGATVQLLEGSTLLGSATADGAGNWAITSAALAEGAHNLTARATDAAGNTSAASSALAVTLDTTGPAVSAPDLAAASDSGSSSSDNLTKLTMLSFAGTAEAGATVSLLEGSTVLGSTTATGGAWSISASSLASGVHSLTVRGSDAAGNQITSAALAVTIDTTAPAVSTPDLAAASDDGSSNSDNVTSITTPVFSGTAEAGATIELLEGNTVLGSATADGAGNWSITASVLASGTHNLAARATDLAGNQTTSGALAVTIGGTPPTGNWFDTNIQNVVIRTVGSQEFQDGLIDRSDMINLLRQVETTGSIDAVEMSDLQLIVNTASLFGSLDYVDNLASKIVLGSTANAQYQGATLGNLAVGSSAAQLELLVDKWFLGTDHPAAASGYSVVPGPLFANGASYTDIAQGGLGDCGLMAALGEIAYRRPDIIQSMFIVNGDGTYTVRLYNNGTTDYLTVDNQLPAGYASIANELWVGLAEKAWAQFYEVVYGPNSYSAITGTFIFDAFSKITGQSTVSFTALNSNGLTSFINAFNAGKMIGFISKVSGTTDGVVANHAYAVIGYDASTQSITLFNPWGVGIGNGGLITLTWGQIQTSFDYFDRTR